MEPKQYVGLLLRWYWLVILGIALGGAAAYLTYADEGSTYTAETTLFIGGAIFSPNPNTGQLQLGSQLAVLYSEMVQYDIVLEGVVDALDLPYSTNYLRSRVSAFNLEETPFLIVVAEFDDRDLAIDVANAVAEQLILNSPTNITPEDQAQIDLATTQIALLNQRLDSVNAQIADIDRQIAELGSAPVEEGSGDEASTQAAGAPTVSPVDQAELQRLILLRGEFDRQATDISTNIAQFSSQIISIRQRVNTLEVIQPANRAIVNSPRSRRSTAIIGAAGGGVLAASLVLLIEYFTTGIRTSLDVVGLLGLPVIGTIMRFSWWFIPVPRKQPLLIDAEMNTDLLEDYRVLAANLILAKQIRADRTFLIASPKTRDGRSSIAANLAITMAMDNIKVLLIDADFRKPAQHLIFGLQNTRGLSELLSTDENQRKSLSNGSVDIQQMVGDLKEYVQKTTLPNLYLLPTGSIAENPVYLLGSPIFRYVIETLRRLLQLDVVILDSPPSLNFADSTIIAAALDPSVIITLRAGRTSNSTALKIAGQFTRMGSYIRGVVLNQVNRRDVDHGYGHDYPSTLRLPEPIVQEKKQTAPLVEK